VAVPFEAEEPVRCEYCGAQLEDPGLAFLEHIDVSDDCRYLWNEFRRNAKREAGET